MEKKLTPGASDTAGTEKELLQFRSEIDAIDDKLIALLLERTAIVSRVGEYKSRTAAGRCPIRPGREAEMLRRILAKFEGTPFSPAAAAAIWRVIIGTSTAVEADLPLSVFAPDRENDMFWLAREYFGMATTVIKQPHIKRVIGDVIDGKAAVGIIPVLRSDDTTYWWTNLMQQGSDAPKIFAHVPFIHASEPDKHAVSALAIAKIMPEPSGDDMTLLVLEADQNTSQHKLQTAFANAKLEATWLNIATLSPQSRHHLVSVRGFHLPENPQMQSVLTPLGNSILSINFLGAYAVPVILTSEKKNSNGASNVQHAAKA